MAGLSDGLCGKKNLFDVANGRSVNKSQTDSDNRT